MSIANTRAGEVGKVLGERWKGLSEAQKAPYDKKAAADKKRYEDEKAAYNAVSVPAPGIEGFVDAKLTLRDQGAADEDEEEE